MSRDTNVKLVQILAVLRMIIKAEYAMTTMPAKLVIRQS